MAFHMPAVYQLPAFPSLLDSQSRDGDFSHSFKAPFLAWFTS